MDFSSLPGHALLKSETWYALVCRPALPKDRKGVLDFTRRIWGGRDYVPHTWDEWLRDTDGMLIVAEFGGQVVGLAKLSYLGEGEYWLQGLRVHPDYRSRGIASRLHNYILERWERSFSGVIRLATSTKRVQVHHLCARTGFVKIIDTMKFEAPGLDGGMSRLTPMRSGDLQNALALSSQNPLNQWTHGLMDLVWAYGQVSEARMEEAIEKQCAFWWAGEGILVLTEGYFDEDKRCPHVQLCICRPSQFTALLLDIRRFVRQVGYESVAWIAPTEFTDALEETGFEPGWEHGLVVYERIGK